ncbi:MAG: T9SS type A sorting domain-containing protein [Saprospiraceae bacterium]|nr:T9SS type A sorting domain-containing protein [Saprospiraceae bacterium]
MKKLVLLTTFWLCLSNMIFSQTETEPNNNAAQANVLIFNGNQNGFIDETDVADWYILRIPQGGNLKLRFSADGGHEANIYLKDSSQLDIDLAKASSYFNDRKLDSLVFPILKGTYYVAVLRSRGSGTYKIESSLQILQWAEDAEPNNESSNSLMLPVNGEVTGLIGHYDTRVKTFDPFDWYKIKIPQGGNLKLRFSADGGHEVNIYLKDSSQLDIDLAKASSYFNDRKLDSLVFPLLKGTYYVAVIRTRGSGAYKIESSLQILQWAEDAEPNNESSNSLMLAVNGEVTGLIGHYDTRVKTFDPFDWYKITIPLGGNLKLRFSADGGHEVNIYLKDSSQLDIDLAKASSYFNDRKLDSLVFPLLKGTYYVAVIRTRGSGAYKIESSLQILQWAEDAEPNNEFSNSLFLPVNGEVTGLIGHYDTRVKTFDPFDWYKITIPQGGNLKLRFSADGGHEVNIYLKDSSQLDIDLAKASSYFNDRKLDSLVFPLLKGTYYVAVIRTRGSGAYKIESSLQISPWGEDKEPNDQWEQANIFSIHSTIGGSINHYNPTIKNYDSEDWFKIKTDRRGLVIINLQSDGNSEATIYIKDSTQLNTNLASASFYFGNKVQDSLVTFVRKGTYYMVIYKSRGSGFYKATSTLIPSPDVKFSYIQNDNRLVFENKTTGSDHFNWNFDDGTPNVSSINPLHEYVLPGEYDVCLIAENRGGKDTLCTRITVRGLARVLPNSGGNTGEVTIQVFGGGLDTFYKVYLVQNNQIKVSSNDVGFGGKGTILAFYDLHNIPVGTYDVLVEKQGGPSYILQNSFTIIQGMEADPWVTISGRDRMLYNTWTNYTITYGNNGNVDAMGVPLWIVVSNQPGVEIDMSAIKIVLPDEAKEWGLQNISQDLLPYTYVDSLFGEPFKGKVYAYMIPFIAPGVTKSFQIKIKTNQDIEVMAWVNPPYYRSPFISDIWECAKKELLTSAIKDGIFGQVKELFGAQTECLLSILDKVNSLRGEATREDRKVDGTTFGVWVYGYGLTLIKCGLAYAPGTGLAATFFTQLAKTQKRLAQAAKILDCARLKDNQRRTIKAVSSLDPNEKSGLTGYGDDNYILDQKTIPYTIHFENKASATAPAHTVYVTDTLDKTTFDLNSFSLGDIVIGDQLIRPEKGLKEYVTDEKINGKNVTARVYAKIDQNTGIVNWVIRSLDPVMLEDIEDPDLGFLPPNITNPEGQGSVSFTVQVKGEPIHDEQIYNSASIVFDANPPILTNEHLVTFDLLAPESSIAPLPATTHQEKVTIHWSGTDSGSGLKSYNIYLSTPDVKDSLWIANTTDKSAEFKGEAGRTYSFYTVAVDNVGNIETQPVSPDAEISFLVATDDVYSDQRLKVYPNPGSDLVHIVAASDISGMFSISDLNGKEVNHLQIAETSKNLISVRDWSSGVYFWKLTNRSGSIITGKIVIIH